MEVDNPKTDINGFRLVVSEYLAFLLILMHAAAPHFTLNRRLEIRRQDFWRRFIRRRRYCRRRHRRSTQRRMNRMIRRSLKKRKRFD